MYKDILESIEKLEISKKDGKSILMENCLEHIFSWNPFKVRNCEYYKRFNDWKTLKKYQDKYGNKSNDKIKHKMSSCFYKREFTGNSTEGDIDVAIKKFEDDDFKIILAMQTLNSQIWHNRISALWANVITILSLVIALISILMKTNN